MCRREQPKKVAHAASTTHKEPINHSATSNVAMQPFSPSIHKFFCTHEIIEDDIDEEENEERTKHQRRFVRYDCKHVSASLMSDYRFNNKQFEQQFQITPSLFEYILRNLALEDAYWHDGFDCMKRSKIKPEVKLLVRLKVVSFGVSFLTLCNYFQRGKSSVREALSRLDKESFKIR